MSYKISEETIKNTTICNHKFQCLNDDNRDVCKINRGLGGNCCSLKTAKPDYCPYMGSFGKLYVCYCPTRHELFKKYKI